MEIFRDQMAILSVELTGTNLVGIRAILCLAVTSHGHARLQREGRLDAISTTDSTLSPPSFLLTFFTPFRLFN